MGEGPEGQNANGEGSADEAEDNQGDAEQKEGDEKQSGERDGDDGDSLKRKLEGWLEKASFEQLAMVGLGGFWFILAVAALVALCLGGSAGWLSGFGTFSAVITALLISHFQAKRTEGRRLEEQAPEFILQQDILTRTIENLTDYRVRNIGSTSASVESIDYFDAEREELMESVNHPTLINPGEEAGIPALDPIVSKYENRSDDRDDVHRVRIRLNYFRADIEGEPQSDDIVVRMDSKIPHNDVQKVVLMRFSKDWNKVLNYLEESTRYFQRMNEDD